MIVITIFAMIAGGVAVALLPRLEEARIKSTKTDAQAPASPQVSGDLDEIDTHPHV